MPPYLHQVLIGLLLSDGSLEKSSPTSLARLSVMSPPGGGAPRFKNFFSLPPRQGFVGMNPEGRVSKAHTPEGTHFLYTTFIWFV